MNKLITAVLIIASLFSFADARAQVTFNVIDSNSTYINIPATDDGVIVVMIGNVPMIMFLTPLDPMLHSDAEFGGIMPVICKWYNEQGHVTTTYFMGSFHKGNEKLVYATTNPNFIETYFEFLGNGQVYTRVDYQLGNLGHRHTASLVGFTDALAEWKIWRESQ